MFFLAIKKAVNRSFDGFVNVRAVGYEVQGNLRIAQIFVEPVKDHSKTEKMAYIVTVVCWLKQSTARCSRKKAQSLMHRNFSFTTVSHSLHFDNT